MRYAIAGLWLLLALLSANVLWPRRFFAYAGSVVALVHLCALGFAIFDRDRGRGDSGVPVGGFYIGIAAGIVLGLILGGFVSRNVFLYYAVQLVVVGFLIFLPLFRL